jgi:hypothetical protein
MTESAAGERIAHQWYARPVLFVELNRGGIDELRREISERSLPTQKAWSGYDVIRTADPDGNELLFPLDETNDRERQR